MISGLWSLIFDLWSLILKISQGANKLLRLDKNIEFIPVQFPTSHDVKVRWGKTRAYDEAYVQRCPLIEGHGNAQALLSMKKWSPPDLEKSDYGSLLNGQVQLMGFCRSKCRLSSWKPRESDECKLSHLQESFKRFLKVMKPSAGSSSHGGKGYLIQLEETQWLTHVGSFSSFFRQTKDP